MKLLITMLPTVILVVYSQLVTKWRLTALSSEAFSAVGVSGRFGVYLWDPYIASSYVAALAGSILWLLVVERYPVSIAFPVYVGLTVWLVSIAGMCLFGERVTIPRIAAICLISAGVIIGSRS